MTVSSGHRDRLVVGEFLNLFTDAPAIAQQRQGISTTMCNLAILYVTMENRMDKAELLAQNAIDAEESTLPRNHPDLATSYEALGIVLAAEGKRSEAKIAFVKA